MKREQSRAGRYGYRLKNKQYAQSRGGKIALLLGIVACCLVVTAIGLAYHYRGKAPQMIGSLGSIALIFSGIGIVYGISGTKERGKRYGMAKGGIVLCAGVLILLAVIFIKGVI